LPDPVIIEAGPNSINLDRPTSSSLSSLQVIHHPVKPAKLSPESTVMSAFQTDSLNPAALPSSTLGRRRPPAASTSAFDPDPSGTAGPSSDPDAATRARFHEEWNVRIDKEVKALAGGMREIVDLADVSPAASAILGDKLS
jgi:hypothetical protein